MVSNFQFTNPILSKIEFSLNNDFDTDSEIKIQTNINTKTIKEDDKNEAIVKLIVKIGEKNKNMPFYLIAEEIARFKWDENKYDDNEIERLLSQNAPALLIGHLRPTISYITNASPLGAYNIPFIDFTNHKS